MNNYTIQRGDTLSAIARRHQTTVAELLRLNPGITNANKILAGQSLMMPQAVQAIAPAAPVPKSAPAPAQTPLPQPQVRTDEALREAALAQLSGGYRAQQQQAQSHAAQQQEALNQMLAALGPALLQQLASLSQGYAQQRQDLSDTALSRGMGRSSYLMDLLGASAQRQTQDEQSLNNQKAQREAAIVQQLMQVQAHLNDTLMRLSGEKEDAIANAIAAMRNEDQSAAQQALRYNNDLSLKQAELLLKQQQDVWKRELEQEKLALSQQKASASGKSSTRTSAASTVSKTAGAYDKAADKAAEKVSLEGGAVYTQQQMQRFIAARNDLAGMTPAERATFLDRNRSRLQSTLGPLWYQLLKLY